MSERKFPMPFSKNNPYALLQVALTIDVDGEVLLTAKGLLDRVIYDMEWLFFYTSGGVGVTTSRAI